MIKTLVIAALAGGLFSVAAPLPAMAKDGMMAYPAHCLVFPLLQAECRDVIRNNTDVVVGNAASAAATATMQPRWSCERRTDGKALLSCSKS